MTKPRTPRPEPSAGRQVAETIETVAEKVESVVGGVVDGASDAVEGAVHAVQAAARRWDERPGARVRRLRRLSRTPLPYLYDRHPEARRAVPRELGVRPIETDEIIGTAVGGATQRGSDFLPLKPFRSQNWIQRWQRIRDAMSRMEVLPPIDVLRYGDACWVLDGHNRVAAAKYGGQVEIDANVVELIPPGGRASERPASLAHVLTGTRALRAAGQGGRASPELEEHIHDPSEGQPERVPEER
ncbi:MAG: hypothetical protein M3R57_04270 [Chloroflexota bacterium]|nr:hypothetical protein [Chloroflexota bacterium]